MRLEQIGGLLAGIAFAMLVRLAYLSRRAHRRPRSLGVTAEGTLRACGPWRNCVSSYAIEDGFHVEPLGFEGNARDALARLVGILGAMPRTTVVTADSRYVHAEQKSALWRFVDDIELLVDESKRVIHVRSSSRVGKSDLGVNRRRVEEIRTRFETEGQR